MTSLERMIFIDVYSRHSNSSPSSDRSDALSLAFENLLHMPYDIIAEYDSEVRTLDISHNKFSRNLYFLSEFENLTSLNLDNNNIDAHTVFPHMPHLRLLWLNHNNVEDLYPFVKNLYKSCPNLRFLSLMGNKAAPSYLNGGSFYEYLQCRLFVISWFPHLVHLDDRVVTEEQSREAKRLFSKPLLERIVEKAPIPDCLKSFQYKVSNIFAKQAILPSNLRLNFIV